MVQYCSKAKPDLGWIHHATTQLNVTAPCSTQRGGPKIEVNKLQAEQWPTEAEYENQVLFYLSCCCCREIRDAKVIISKHMVHVVLQVIAIFGFRDWG